MHLFKKKSLSKKEDSLRKRRYARRVDKNGKQKFKALLEQLEKLWENALVLAKLIFKKILKIQRQFRHTLQVIEGNSQRGEALI